MIELTGYALAVVSSILPLLLKEPLKLLDIENILLMSLNEFAFIQKDKVISLKVDL
jgi:hypothetical protein